MTTQQFKKEAEKNGLKIYSVRSIQSKDGYWNGYKVTGAHFLGENTISGQWEKEIEADCYDELLDKLTNKA